MNSRIDLSIIIVSYNTKVLTTQTIRSVFDTVGNLNTEVIVVDNNSSDQSVESIQKEFGDKVTIIQRKDNPGFATANNDGLKIANGEYLLLLNSDTIVQPGALQALVNTARNNSDYGVLSSSLLNPDGTYQPQGGALPNIVNLTAWWLWPLPGNIPGIDPYQNTVDLLLQGVLPGRDDDPIKMGWVGGTVMLIRKELYSQIGGLDEKIFMYAEDIDYCLRAIQNNWKIGLVPQARVTHIGNASGSSEKAKIGEIKGLLYLASKHHSQTENLVLRGIFALGAILRLVLFGILKGNLDQRKLYQHILQISLGT